MEANKSSRTLEWIVWGGLAVVIAAIAAAFVRSRLKPAAPPPIIGQVADFALTDQNGRPVTLGNLRGQVWVADLIFTRCGGPCPEMTRKLGELQNLLPPRLPAQLVTLTTDPEFDTPAVLKKYAERFGANPRRWMFLTGSKREINNLAVASLKLTSLPVKPEEQQSPADLFIHSTIFVVVDRHGRLRGVFETTGEGVDWAKVRQDILMTVGKLSRER